MSNKFFKSLFAIALVVGSALGFVACEDVQKEVTNPTVEVSVKSLTFSNEEETQSVEVIANGDWKVTVDYLTGEDWIIVTPMAGNGNTTISVAVPMNNSGAIREATIKVIALHPVYGNWDVKKIKVAQSSTETPPVAEALLYGDNFDGKKATKEYGSSNTSWPYIDQFPEFANAEGPASENVTYSGSGVSVRANSESNGGYSDYAGSGANNIFFGGGAYFQVNDIALDASQLSYKMTFGSEKYTQDGDSTFKNEEFLVYISKDGLAWAPVEYTFAGTEPGRWNVATANFTLAAGTEVLYVKFEAKVASVYRLDDVKLFTGNGGQTIDLDNIEEPTPVPPSTEALYYENFDGKGATKDGNGYWPYVDQLPEMKNAVGPAAANVSYEGHNTTVRNNSNSDGTYSDYAGSGVNNIFFGKGNAWFMVKELALESSQKDLVLTFGTEKYSQSLGSLFKPEEFIVSLSGDGEKWSNVDYTFAGTAEGRWNVATANFTLKEVPAKLYIKFMATAESAYRLDDVTLNVGDGGQEVDLAAGTTGGDNGGQNPTPDTDAYYFDNFDGKEATKTYGSGSSWPYIDQFPEFANAVGSAAGSVTYTGKAVSVRNNSNSNGTYSDYAGSGLNNIFFGADAYFQVSGIALASDQKNLTLTFGTEKYSQDNGSKFTPSEFHVLLSADGEKWSEISYTFAGTAEGRWNVATANFTLKEVPASLHIKFVVDVASSYRIDDLSLAAGEGGQSVDLANGSENPGGGEEPENPEQPEDPDQPVVPGDGEFASDSVFVCSEDDSNNGVYSLKATAINGESTTGFKLGTSAKTGVFTSQAVGTEGDMTLGFYAVAWKNGVATLYVKVDNGAVESFELAPNDGATSNPPYNALSFKESDHYTINLTGLTASSKISFSTSPDFNVVESAAPRAILCGVKLTSEQGSEPEPEIVTLATPEVTATVADGKVTVKWGAIENAASYDVTFDGKTTNVKATEYQFDAPEAAAEMKKYSVSVVAKPAEGTNYTASAAGKAEFTIEAKNDEPENPGDEPENPGDEPENPGDEPETPGDEPETPGDEPETPGDDIVYTSVADFFAAEVNDSKYYYLKGTITRVANTSYGNFDLTDDTGTVYIYGLNSEDGSTNKYWADSGAKLGDDIVIYATRAEFNGSAQGGNARFVELTSPGTRAFWSFSKDAVVFGSAAGEQVITVEAYNLTANVVASSDNDQFAVSYANGTLTISAKENATTEVINGKITVESGALKQVITVAQNGVSVGGGTEVEAEAVMAEQGWANSAAVKEVKLDDNVVVKFAKGEASNAPAYYDSGNAVRLYQNGATMTVSANGKTIKSMEITFADNHYYMEPDCGEFSAEGETRIWTGEATEVVFTTTGTDKNHRAYIAAIKVTYID